jgi:WD40 repeat protein
VQHTPAPLYDLLQIKVFKEHAREVTDLSFDASGEFLASGAADGTIAVHGLYSEEVARIRASAPVTVRSNWPMLL